MSENIQKELLLASYYEHMKFAKDLAMFLEVNDPKRVKIESAVNDIAIKLNLNNK